jgi:hypothetical protein
MRLFYNCRLYTRAVLVACKDDSHHPSWKSSPPNPLPLFKRNYAARILDAKRSRRANRRAGGRSRALTACITRRDTVGAHPFAPAYTLIVIHSTARNGRINLLHANQHRRSLADEHVANSPPTESHASRFGFVPRLSLNVPANWTSGTHAHIAFSQEYI